MYILLTFRHST